VGTTHLDREAYLSKWLIDCDSTLNQFQEHQIATVNNKFGTSYDVSEVSHWHWWQEDTPELHSRHAWCDEVFHSRDWTLACPVAPGAREGMRALAALGHELYVVSDREPHMKEWLETWLWRHSIQVKEVIVSDRVNHPKWMVAKELGLTFVVEDAPHNANDISVNCPDMEVVFLLNKPWNKVFEEFEPIFRVDTWNQVVAQAVLFDTRNYVS